MAPDHGQLSLGYQGESPKMVDQTLNAEGLLCPLPVLKARKTLAGMAPGEILAVRVTDRGAVQDFAAFAEASGHALLENTEEDGVLIFHLRKAAPG